MFRMGHFRNATAEYDDSPVIYDTEINIIRIGEDG